jgi:pyridoxal phosphate enzyme (YggS family)
LSAIGDTFRQIEQLVETAAQGRPIKIVAVSKTVPPQKMEEAYNAGARIFGENRIQEALPKIEVLQHLDIQWHFIGHLQTNKARDAVRHFTCIQSIDSLKLLNQIDQEASKLQRPMTGLLEVNLAGEQSKFGFSREHLTAALEASKSLETLRITGLMIIPPFMEDVDKVRPYFRELKGLQQKHLATYPSLTELSMGMSHDYQVAIEEGSTMVRIGTALFGERVL